MLLGIAIGTGLILWLRVEYYEWQDLRPNMAPQIAYLFSPIILGQVCIVALPFEWLLRRRWFSKSVSRPHSLAAGMAWATLLTYWAFPGMGEIALICNPIIVRALIWWGFNAKKSAS